MDRAGQKGQMPVPVHAGGSKEKGHGRDGGSFRDDSRMSNRLFQALLEPQACNMRNAVDVYAAATGRRGWAFALTD